MGSRVCAHPGCATITTTSYCPDHTPKAWGTSTRRSTLPPDWRRLRLRVLRRDRWRCRTCGQPATEVDHIVPSTAGGSDAMTNLQALCRRCHSTKTLAEAQAARQGRGARG